MCPPSGRCSRCGKHARYAWMTRAMCERCFEEEQQIKKAKMLEIQLRAERRKEKKAREDANPLVTYDYFSQTYTMPPAAAYWYKPKVAETKSLEVEPDVMCEMRPVSFED